MRKFVWIGIIVVFTVDVVLFLWLLVNKIRSNRRAREDSEKRVYYRNKLDEILHGSEEGLLRPNNQKDMEIFKEVLLEAFDSYDHGYFEGLKSVARQAGVVKDELKELSSSSILRRATAAYTLGVLRVQEAVPFLLKMKSTNLVLTQSIHRALLQIDGLKQMDKILARINLNELSQKSRALDLFTEIQEDVFSFLELDLQGDDDGRKSLALEVLGERQDFRVKQYLEENILSGKKELMISGLKAAIKLQCFDCSVSPKEMTKLVTHENWEIRTFMAKVMAFAKGSEIEVAEYLKALLEDDNWNVRFNAAESLFALGEKGIVALSQCLRSEDKFAREKAWDVLMREWNLYDLEERLRGFDQEKNILSAMEEYRYRLLDEETLKETIDVNQIENINTSMVNQSI